MRHNEALTKTRQLKAKVNDLRREKLAFKEVLFKLDKVLGTQRSDLATALRNVQSANAARNRVGNFLVQRLGRRFREKRSMPRLIALCSECQHAMAAMQSVRACSPAKPSPFRALSQCCFKDTSCMQLPPWIFNLVFAY